MSDVPAIRRAAGRQDRGQRESKGSAWDDPHSRAAPRGTRADRDAGDEGPIRLLTAVPICDGHDSAISTINLELVHAGMEVIYLGYNRSATEIVRAAIQEDVRGVGISSYNGGHVEFFARVVEGLRQRGAGHIGVFGGGGGTITHADAKEMAKRGVERIIFAGTPLKRIVEAIRNRYAKAVRKVRGDDEDLVLARALTECELAAGRPPKREARSVNGASGSREGELAKARVIGITGPGGVGKTTLIDELVLRMLRRNPHWRIAILSHDPSLVGNGALLGDRAAMIYAQDDRVFMRSLATRGQAGGLSATTGRCLSLLREGRVGPMFDMILLETVGIGQEAAPFSRDMVDRSVLVMSPDYGSRLQLQKISMIDLADLVVVNKSDLAGARTASSEIESRLRMGHRDGRVIATVAKRHGDSGVDRLFDALLGTGGS